MKEPLKSKTSTTYLTSFNTITQPWPSDDTIHALDMLANKPILSPDLLIPSSTTMHCLRRMVANCWAKTSAGTTWLFRLLYMIFHVFNMNMTYVNTINT